MTKKNTIRLKDFRGGDKPYVSDTRFARTAQIWATRTAKKAGGHDHQG